MTILINKNGKQLGPFSLEEARAQVLSGQLTANDWAWPDGASKWVRLKDVPGFSAVATGPAPTDAPPDAPASTEQELWRGHPSQMLNLTVYLSWAIVLLGGVALYVFAPHFWVVPALAILGVIALVHVSIYYFRLRAIEYVVTTQRVRIVSGIFSKDIQEIELFRVKDTMAHQTFFLRLFGLGTITILSGDERHPQLVLSAVPRAMELRERLRQEVMILRQRFGVRELDVM